jgi:hypothetical protein
MLDSDVSQLQRLATLLDEAEAVYAKTRLQGRLPPPMWAGITGMTMGADLASARVKAHQLLSQVESARRVRERLLGTQDTDLLQERRVLDREPHDLALGPAEVAP